MSHPVNSRPAHRDWLASKLPPRARIEQQARGALDEDLGGGSDCTAELIPAHQRSQARIEAREAGVLCGCAWVEATFRLLDPSVELAWHLGDGQSFSAGEPLCHLQGRTRALLTGERTALNYLQVLSGTATRARRYVEAIDGLAVRVLDTRKTLPGLREQQKYAVLCGGGHNHRRGLYDAILIKENHILACGSIGAALEAAARVAAADMPVEIEVESIGELQEALGAGVRHILLDNFSPERLREAVAVNAGRARLEASGGITLLTIRAIAETGIDDISIGDLTKDVRAIDLSMQHLGRG